MKQKPKICVYCGQEFIPERRHAMYCSSTCRQYNYIQRKTGEAPGARVKEKEFANHQLQSVPALVIENQSEENNVEQNQELSIASMENHQINQTLNTMETINTPVIDDNPSKKSYQELIRINKESLNDMLTAWWEEFHNSHKEKIKLVVAIKRTKVFIERMLNSDRKEISQINIRKFLGELQAWEKDPRCKTSDFLPAYLVVADMEEIVTNCITEMQASKHHSTFFKLPFTQKAHLDVMLQFMNAFDMQTPAFWTLS